MESWTSFSRSVFMLVSFVYFVQFNLNLYNHHICSSRPYLYVLYHCVQLNLYNWDLSPCSIVFVQLGCESLTHVNCLILDFSLRVIMILLFVCSALAELNLDHMLNLYYW